MYIVTSSHLWQPLIKKNILAICCFTRFCQSNSSKGICPITLKTTQKFYWLKIMLLLIIVKCEMSSAKWCFQTFYKPGTTETEDFGRRVFIAISMTDLCQWALCYRWLGNCWTVTWANVSVKFNNLSQWGYVNSFPSSREEEEHSVLWYVLSAVPFFQKFLLNLL